MGKLLILLISLISLNLNAKDGSDLTIQPIVGLERVQKLSPTPKTKTRTIVGARVLYGPPLFSFEAEVTRSDDTETLPERNLTEKEESYVGRVGVRSTLSFPFTSFYLRAGGQARKSEYTTTQDGVTTTRTPAVYASPYAGTGLNVNILGKFNLNAGVTVIFTGRPKGSDREYQTTLGFGVRI